jgi:hypothetical protein
VRQLPATARRQLRQRALLQPELPEPVHGPRRARPERRCEGCREGQREREARRDGTRAAARNLRRQPHQETRCVVVVVLLLLLLLLLGRLHREQERNGGSDCRGAGARRCRVG